MLVAASMVVSSPKGRQLTELSRNQPNSYILLISKGTQSYADFHIAWLTYRSETKQLQSKGSQISASIQVQSRRTGFQE